MLVLLGRLLDDPVGAGLVFLAFAIAVYAAGTYGVRAHRSWKGKNGRNGEELGLAEFSKDLHGIGPPKPPRQRGGPFIAAPDETIQTVALQVVSKAAFDATISGVHRRIDEVSVEGTELRERMVRVEQTCKRTEAAVEVLRKENKLDLQAQTVELTRVLSGQILSAFQALDNKTGERIEGLRKELRPGPEGKA